MSDLVVEKAVLEVRYPQGFLYWDRSGRIWNELSEEYPQIRFDQVGLGNTVIKLDRSTTVTMGPNSTSVAEEYPGEKLRSFEKTCDIVLKLIVDALELLSYSRVGHRTIWSYPVPNASEATEILLRSPLLSHIRRLRGSFKKDAEVREPSIGFRMETEDVGYLVRAFVAERSPTFELPPPLRLDTSNLARNAVLFDVDYYTRQPSQPQALTPSALIADVQRTLERELIPTLFEEPHAPESDEQSLH